MKQTLKLPKWPMLQYLIYCPRNLTKQYDLIYLTYNRFKELYADKNVVQLTDTVLLAYFSDRSTKVKSSTLWSEYSMIRASLSVKENMDIHQI